MKMISFNYTNSWQCEHGGWASHQLCEHWCRASLHSGHNYTRLFVEHSYQISLVLGCPGLSHPWCWCWWREMLRTTWRCNLVFLIGFVFLSSKVMLLPVTAAQAEHIYSDFMSYINCKGGTLIWLHKVSSGYYPLLAIVTMPPSSHSFAARSLPRVCRWPPQDSGGGHITSHHISALAAWSPVPRSEEGLTHKLWQKEDFHAKSWKSKTTQLKIRVETKLGEKDKLGIWAGMMEERWCGQSINKQRRNE